MWGDGNADIDGRSARTSGSMQPGHQSVSSSTSRAAAASELVDAAPWGYLLRGGALNAEYELTVA
ncbi:hypothetical protein GCM10023324_07480 [Streptomyces youssoufiensis]